uniref:Trehalase n=1 Tax=Electrophorus electricus TaxID=8005 RepID=A0AAY5ENV5_ELEEL
MITLLDTAWVHTQTALLPPLTHLLRVCMCVCAPMSPSKIYCTGELLRQVQTAKLFDDNKSFVDMKLAANPEVVMEAFSNLSQRFPNGTAPPSELWLFVNAYFVDDGKQFEPWTPPDWHERPVFLSKVSDSKLRGWAEELHGLWKSLGRKVGFALYSMIYSPNPVIIPGGRFTEFYYWDSYWVLNGLLLSEMTDTARGMIQNFLHMVDRYGFVPNGGRIYYERRSQPPFLSLMVESFYEATGDVEFLRQALPTLVKEYMFWMENRSTAVEVNGTSCVLNQPALRGGHSRAEKLWAELKSAAESGWDFSSRWYTDTSHGGPGSLQDTSVSSVLPVDLNALLCRCEHLLASFHRTLSTYLIPGAMESVLWDVEKGAWFDYNLQSGVRNYAFYPTNLSPLWARCYSQPAMGLKALHYLRGSGGLDYPNGVPTSLRESTQQWDLPNAWPPLQHMLIEGLAQLDSADSQELAFALAQRWIHTNWLAYAKYRAMFEKYDVSGDGKPGGGGEYEVQLGFGWTNGVALQLLDQYGDRLSSGGMTYMFSNFNS